MQLGLSKFEKNLEQQLIKEYSILNGYTVVDAGPVMQIKGHYNNLELIHWFYKNNETLRSGPVSISPVSDEKIFHQVLTITNNIAKYAGCTSISVQAEFIADSDRKIFEKAGYKFIKGSYKRKVE